MQVQVQQISFTCNEGQLKRSIENVTFQTVIQKIK